MKIKRINPTKKKHPVKEALKDFQESLLDMNELIEDHLDRDQEINKGWLVIFRKKLTIFKAKFKVDK